MVGWALSKWYSVMTIAYITLTIFRMICLFCSGVQNATGGLDKTTNYLRIFAIVLNISHNIQRTGQGMSLTIFAGRIEAYNSSKNPPNNILLNYYYRKYLTLQELSASDLAL